MHIATDRHIRLGADVATVWAAMSDIDSYRVWWPWLKTFDANALGENEIWNCAVQPPLRYMVAFSIKFDVVVPDHHIEASIRGDIVGGAWIDLEEIDGASDACDVWIRSFLAPQSTFLKRLSTVIAPVARAGHDWVISTGAKQFEKRALT